jgi:hypothetical protein
MKKRRPKTWKKRTIEEKEKLDEIIYANGANTEKEKDISNQCGI